MGLWFLPTTLTYFVQLEGCSPIEFLSIEKKDKYIPSSKDLDKLIEAANPDTQDYLWCVRETMGRIGEINRLEWNDIDFTNRCVTLRTRKKKGGNLTARKVPMTNKLFDVLSKRYALRDKRRPWVFWHTYRDKITKKRISGPYKDRKVIMSNLCNKAGLNYFRYHALRHSGASILDSINVPIGAIQKILGHENRSTTEIYLHSFGEVERAAMARFEANRQNNSHTGLTQT